ncbi:50S ribosomal protein L25 [Chloroflexota bacterium]
MDDITLQVANRDVLGKKTRFLRRQKITPVHLFGQSLESRALQCDTTQLQNIIARAGKTKLINLAIEDEKLSRSVFIREIQRDEVSRQLLHVDFFQVKKEKKIAVDVPIVLVGEAPAMKEKGRLLTHGVTSLSIECLPGNVPAQIEVDLGPLEDLEQAIHVKDIAISPDITVNADPDQLVVKIGKVAVEKVEAEAVEVEAETKAEVPTEEAMEQTPAD